MDSLYPSYAKKLRLTITSQFSHLYVQLFLIWSVACPAAEAPKTVERLSKDKEALAAFLGNLLLRFTVYRLLKPLEFLHSALTAEPRRVAAQILSLQVFMKKLFDSNCSKAILRLRPDIDPQHKQRLLAVLETETNAIQQARAKALLDKQTKTFRRVDQHVKQFVQKLLLKREERKLLRLRSSTGLSLLVDDSLQPDPALVAKFEADFEDIRVSEKMAELTNEEFAAVRAAASPAYERLTGRSSLKMDTRSLVLQTEMVYWQKAANAKKIKGRVYLASLVEVNVWTEQLVYLVRLCDVEKPDEDSHRRIQRQSCTRRVAAVAAGLQRDREEKQRASEVPQVSAS